MSCDSLSKVHPELFSKAYGRLVQFVFPFLAHCFVKIAKKEESLNSELGYFISASLHYFFGL